jgi:hypothetical protein
MQSCRSVAVEGLRVAELCQVLDHHRDRPELLFRVVVEMRLNQILDCPLQAKLIDPAGKRLRNRPIRKGARQGGHRGLLIALNIVRHETAASCWGMG